MKKILSGLLFAALLLTSAASAVLAQQAGTPSLYFDPADVTVKLNDTFLTKIMMDTAGQDALGGGAQIIYDPTVVSVVEVKGGETFEVYPATVFDNAKGQATISGIASSADDTFSGVGTFGQVTWKLLKAQQTTISYSFTPGSTTDSNIAVSSGNGDILASVGQLVVTPGTATVVTGTTQTAQATSAPSTWTQFSTGAKKTFQKQTEKITSLFSSDDSADEVDTSIDPYGPITQTEPITTVATQPTNVKPVVINEDEPAIAASGSSMLVIGLIVLVVLALLGLIFWLMTKKSDKDKKPPATTVTKSTTTTTVSEPMVMATPASAQPAALQPQQAVPPTPVLRPQEAITAPGETKAA